MKLSPEAAPSRDAPPSCTHCLTRHRCVFQSVPGAADKLQVREFSVRPDSVLEVQGEHQDTLGVIKVGQAKGSRTVTAGKHKAIIFLGRGRVVGLGSAFRHRSPLTLTSLTPMRVCAARAELLHNEALSDERFLAAVVDAAGRFVNCVTDWSGLLREDDFGRRLHRALQMIATEEGSCSFRIPSHAQLADLLGSRRETVSRYLGTLVEQGQLRKLDRWHGVLADCAGRSATAG